MLLACHRAGRAVAARRTRDLLPATKALHHTEAAGHRVLAVQELGDGTVCPSGCPSTAAFHRFSVRIIFFTWVELRGLEPLASCMPWNPTPSTTVQDRSLQTTLTCGFVHMRPLQFTSVHRGR
jgi:hypothetical protein